MNNFEMEGLTAQGRPVEVGKGKNNEGKRELPNEECDAVREYKAMHEEDFWSNWLREDERSEEERKAKAESKEEEKGEKRKREEEKEENETATGKRRCDGFVSVAAFEVLSQGRDLENCGHISWEDLLEEPEDLSGREPVSGELVRVVPVSLRLWSPSCVMFPLVTLIEILLNRGPFLSPKTCSLYSCAGRDEVRRLTGESVSAFKKKDERRMTPPTPVQNSYTSFVRDHGRHEVEGRGWNARERTIIARTKQFLERSHCVKVQVEAFRRPVGSQKMLMWNFRRILKEARDE